MKKIIFILVVAMSLSACVDNAREKQKENEIVTGLKPATKKIAKRKKTQAEIRKEIDDAVAEAAKAKKVFAGLYSCKRTHDIYFFNEDGTGFLWLEAARVNARIFVGRNVILTLPCILTVHLRPHCSLV